MSTIVTYNQGAQGGPQPALARIADPSNGSTFFTDFMSLDVAGTDVALSGNVPHSLLLDDDANASYFTTGSCVINADSMESGDFAFVARARVLSTRANGDTIQFGFSTTVGTPTTDLAATANNLCIKLVQGGTAAADAVVCAFDDQTNEKAETVILQNVAGLGDFDSQDWHTYGAVCKPGISGYVVQYFVDGVEVKRYNFGTRGAGGPMECGALTVASDGGYLIDWFACTTPAAV